MITTVTVTTVTTVTAIAALGLAGVIGIALAVTLMFFLTSRELAGASGSSFNLRIAKFVSVGILPLVMAFVVTVAVRIAEVL
ncbi:hypothetical protein ACFLYG_01540 [Chloroflexota bacterium]